jgi:2,4-dienoyl-CoA reductase-like NADH-dependent reductase (Old Yellow Enzyme family)
MTKITDELVIRGNHIKNRIVMAPMVIFSFHGDNGSYYGKQHIEHYTKRAKGGTGLTIVQATSVFGALDSTGMWTTGDIAALKQIASSCHEYGATIMMQLHCGNMDINKLSATEIHSMQTNMGQTAIRACEISFDGVEYHFAHGFTLCKFLMLLTTVE